MSDPPVIGFAGYSGSGKTTLIEKLIPCLKDKNIRIGLIKRAHHKFDIDQPGKDSYRFRKAGALQVLVASSQRWALMTETPDQHSDPVLRTLIQRLDRTSLDLIMVEGFKHETIPKIEVYRKTDNRPPAMPGERRRLYRSRN